MHGTMPYAPPVAPTALHDQASTEVWDLVRDLEAVLPPTQMALVHKLRLAAELVGSMRASVPMPAYGLRSAASMTSR